MTTSTTDRSHTLTLKLDALRGERDLAFAELASSTSGDIADRATNVEANVRFALLEQRIHAVEIEMNNQKPKRVSDGSVAEGDIVTLDLGDGPETFLFGSVEQSGNGLDVVTPGSPLGAAIHGATAGTTVTYKIRSRTLTATVVSVS